MPLICPIRHAEVISREATRPEAGRPGECVGGGFGAETCHSHYHITTRSSLDFCYDHLAPPPLVASHFFPGDVPRDVMA